MKRILRKRILLVVGVIIVFFVLLIFFFEEPEKSQVELPLFTDSGDAMLPISGILSPQHLSWHNTGFALILKDIEADFELADFTLGEQGCRYVIQDLGTDIAYSDWRPCGEVELFLSVGEHGICSSSFEYNSSGGRCRVSTQAIDKQGNESGWKSRIFQVDFTAPNIGKISLPEKVLPGEEQLFEAKVSDNSKIIGCSLYLNNEAVDKEVSFSAIPCKNGDSCTVSLFQGLEVAGEYTAFFVCSDIAGNKASGEQTRFMVFENHAPEISFCRVVPTQGNVGDEFSFEVEARDADGDTLSFSWDFGDGITLEEQFPLHVYFDSGTYMPKVLVWDLEDKAVSCNTAWVVVGSDQ